MLLDSSHLHNQRLLVYAGVSFGTLLNCFLFPAAAFGEEPSTAITISSDTVRGRIVVENNVLKLEFGYKQESKTHFNQGGGNLYQYIDKRFSTTANVVSVWDGGTGNTQAYASAVGGIGGTQIYATPDLDFQSGSYQYAMADNVYARMLANPVIDTLEQGDIRIIFRMNVRNPRLEPVYAWYELTKTWTIAPAGLITLQHDWTILRDGYFSEPASRHQIDTRWTTISRHGHPWSTPPSGPPGSNSRDNSANTWYDWTPDPASVQECGWVTPGMNQDALHADYIRFHGGVSHDFWFWCYGNGRGYEGEGFYQLGYAAFGASADASVLEICHHNRTSIGDGGDAYNVGPMAWWGGDGATADRYKPLTAQTKWTDTYKMEVRANGQSFPPDTAVTQNATSVSIPRSATSQQSRDHAGDMSSSPPGNMEAFLASIPSGASVAIYTLRGALVGAFRQSSGRAGASGRRLPAGMYYVRVSLDDAHQTPISGLCGR